MKGKRGAILTAVIILVFIAILWACDLVGQTFGPWGENIALGIIALILLIGFFKARKESLEEKEKVDNENEWVDEDNERL